MAKAAPVGADPLRELLGADPAEVVRDCRLGIGAGDVVDAHAAAASPSTPNITAAS